MKLRKLAMRHRHADHRPLRQFCHGRNRMRTKTFDQLKGLEGNWAGKNSQGQPLK